jgi:hypothetical protein
MWESSRMMLPEHRLRINEHGDINLKGGPRKRPVLDDQEIEDMSRKLQESLSKHIEVAIDVWDRDDPVQGVVTKIDTYFRRITVDLFWGETETIRLDNIIKVKSPE